MLEEKIFDEETIFYAFMALDKYLEEKTEENDNNIEENKQ